MNYSNTPIIWNTLATTTGHRFHYRNPRNVKWHVKCLNGRETRKGSSD